MCFLVSPHLRRHMCRRCRQGFGSRTIITLMSPFQVDVSPFVDVPGAPVIGLLMVNVITCAIRNYCMDLDRKIIIEVTPRLPPALSPFWHTTTITTTTKTTSATTTTAADVSFFGAQVPRELGQRIVTRCTSACSRRAS